MSSVNRYKQRRDILRERISHTHPKSVIMITAAVEPLHGIFRQDKTFYYYTGIQEPGATLLILPDGTTELFVPNYHGVRDTWVGREVVLNDERTSSWGIDVIRHLGAPERGYSIFPFRSREQYEGLVNRIEELSSQGMIIAVTGNPTPYAPAYADQLSYLVLQEARVSDESVVCIVEIISQQRRIKDDYEIACIRKAIEITGKAQEAARAALVGGAYEYEVQAALESVMVAHGCQKKAFPSIVATGKNATVLHYLDRDAQCKDGELAVIDIGVEYNEYAADLTRTWAIGTVTQRHKDIAQTVAYIQKEVAKVARPGVFLRSRTEPGNSLDGVARELLSDCGFASAMPHSIGHFLGLDVHDVGDANIPLMPGDVITIEPGIYLRDEGIGVRIEDNYLITESGAECLSSTVESMWDGKR